MSYNTRRTGGGANRQAPTTQVNYHQQPNRTASGNTAQQNRNVGYSTSQPPVTYNNPAQGSYSTPAYTTAPPQPPPPPTQQKPAQPQAAPPTPATPAAKPPADTAASVPATLKQEPVTPGGTETTAENGNANGPKVPYWKKRPFVKLSNKVRRARQNAKLRRILNPKNALTFLNELRPGSGKFVVKEDPGWGFMATVEVDGKSFTGHGLGASKAKVAASEKALRYLLLEQLAKAQEAAAQTKDETNEDEKMDLEEEGDESKGKSDKVKPEDEVPWGSLAAFAIHKLFSEWQNEGPADAPLLPIPNPMEKYDEDIGDDNYFARRPMGPEFSQYRGRGFPPYTVRGRGFAPYPAPRGPPPAGYGVPPNRRLIPPGHINPATPAATFSAALKPPGSTNSAPMKKIPEDANQRHPVMLLNQLKPNLVYHESKEGEQPRVTFVIAIEVDGQQYVGRGKNKKEAKKQAAKAALAPMGVIYNSDD